MLTEPTDRIVVTTAGRASGMEPTARATPMPKRTVKDSPCASPMTRMAMNAKSAAPMMKMVSRSTCLVRGVFSTFCPASRCAMCRHAVTSVDENDVPGHDLLGGDLDDGAVAPHLGHRLQHGAESRGRRVGLPLLVVAQPGVEEGQQRQPDCCAPLTDHQADDR